MDFAISPAPSPEVWLSLVRTHNIIQVSSQAKDEVIHTEPKELSLQAHTFSPFFFFSDNLQELYIQ